MANDIPGRLVVRTYAPVRQLLILSAVVVLVVVAAYLMFELGRKKAGFDGIQAAQERALLNDRISELQRQQRELRVQLTAAEETQRAQVRERSEVARTIGELQAQLALAQQDLQFYRGIANPQAPQGVSVRVQQFQVAVRSLPERRYTLRFTLIRESRPEESITGAIGITVDGERAGSAASVDLATASDNKVKQLNFSFRYYANLEQPITLPADFKPERVTIEVRPGRKGMASNRQTFVWNP
jgi:hypothetical protein